MTTGHDWNGRTVTPAKVLYLAGEGMSIMGPRLRALEREEDIRFNKNVLFMPGPRQWAHHRQKGVAFLEAIAAIERFRPDVIFLDTIFAHNPGVSIRDEEGTGEIFAVARNLSLHYGCAVVMIHHAPKHHRSPYGSVSLWGNVDQLVYVGEVDRNPGILKIEMDGRFGAGGSIGGRYHIKSGHGDATFAVTHVAAKTPAQDKVLEYVQLNPGSTTATIQATIWGKSGDHARSRLKALQETGAVDSTDERGAVRWWPIGTPEDSTTLAPSADE